MRLLVTGAHGFIGSHLTERLLESGHSVRGLVTPWGDTSNLAAAAGQPGLEIVRGDVTKPATLAGVCQNVDAVVHAAARLADWGSPGPLLRTNSEGTANLLKAAEEAGTPRFVLVSSLAVHTYRGFRNADPEALPRDNRRLAYARSKIAAEDLVFAWSGEGVVVRPGLWPFGSRDSQTRRVAAALRDGRLPLLGSGNRVLNTAYVRNLALGLELAATVPGVRRRAFVIADEGAPTWWQVLSELAHLIRSAPPRLRLPPALVSPVAAGIETAWHLVAPEAEPPLTRYRASLMRHDVHFSLEPARLGLGYEPQVSWQEGLAETVERDPVLKDLAGRVRS